MSYSEYLDRLMTLEKSVAELTGRVYRLEHAPGATAAEAVAERPVMREAAPPVTSEAASAPVSRVTSPVEPAFSQPATQRYWRPTACNRSACCRCAPRNGRSAV